jgi:hypothetical protein
MRAGIILSNGYDGRKGSSIGSYVQLGLKWLENIRIKTLDKNNRM